MIDFELCNFGQLEKLFKFYFFCATKLHLFAFHLFRKSFFLLFLIPFNYFWNFFFLNKIYKHLWLLWFKCTNAYLFSKSCFENSVKYAKTVGSIRTRNYKKYFQFFFNRNSFGDNFWTCSLGLFLYFFRLIPLFKVLLLFISIYFSFKFL